MKLNIPTALILFSLQAFSIGPDFDTERLNDVLNEDTPVEMPDMHTEKTPPPADNWVKPDYSNQQHALGYAEGLFDIPASLETRVNFWKNIYTKYTSDQGVVHDSKYIDVIYKEIDFGPITSSTTMNDVQKSKARAKVVKEAKRDAIIILTRLHKLSRNGSPNLEELTSAELEMWKRFEKISEPNKFQNASLRGRIRFQLGQRDRVELGILYSGRYLRRMEEIFRLENMPVQLTRLPFVESSFNIYARSKVGASGIWQFVPRTGRAFMKVNKHVDERNDPVVATKGAAKLLKQNFNLLGTWPLALTGYNHGAYGLQRLSNKLKTKDLAEIIQKSSKRSFGFAGENFYSCFLAVVHVEANADKYFGNVKRSPELIYEIVPTTTTIGWSNVVEWFEGDEDKAKLYNPHINRPRKGNFEIPRSIELHLPMEKRDIAITAMEDMAKRPRSTKVASSALMKQAEAAEIEDRPVKKSSITVDDPKASVYRVKRGDNLTSISKKLGISVRDLMEANNLKSAKKIRPGMKLMLPSFTNEPEAPVQPAPIVSVPAAGPDPVVVAPGAVPASPAEVPVVPAPVVPAPEGSVPTGSESSSSMSEPFEEMPPPVE